MSESNESKVDAMLSPPELLARYKEMGLGDNLVDLVKDEQKHRHSLQKKYFCAYILGQILGCGIIVFFLTNIFCLMKQGLKQESYILSLIFCCLMVIITYIIRSNRMMKRKQQIINYTQARRNIRTPNYPVRRNNNSSNHR